MNMNLISTSHGQNAYSYIMNFFKLIISFLTFLPFKAGGKLGNRVFKLKPKKN